MATSSPFVKLLRQLSTVQEEYRSGSFDLTWDSGHASLYFVFGQPNHAEYDDATHEKLEGDEALTALLQHLPARFEISPVTKRLVRNPTLKCTIGDLIEPLTSLAGTYFEEAPLQTDSDIQSEDDGVIRAVGITLETFPLLPVGKSLWTEASARIVNLDLLIPKLPTTLIVVTGPKLRACAIVEQGLMLDALWVQDNEAYMGESAAMAIQNSKDTTVSGYKLDSREQAEALIMLWRSPIAYKQLKAEWLNIDNFIADLAQSQTRSCVLEIKGEQTGYAFFAGGQFTMAYTNEDRVPSDSPALLRSLLEQPSATIDILQGAGDKGKAEVNSEESYHVYVEGEDAIDLSAAASQITDENLQQEAPALPVEEPLEQELVEPEVPSQPVYAAEGTDMTANEWPAPEDPSTVDQPEAASDLFAASSYATDEGDVPIYTPPVVDEDNTPGPDEAGYTDAATELDLNAQPNTSLLQEGQEGTEENLLPPPPDIPALEETNPQNQDELHLYATDTEGSEVANLQPQEQIQGYPEDNQAETGTNEFGADQTQQYDPTQGYYAPTDYEQEPQYAVVPGMESDSAGYTSATAPATEAYEPGEGDVDYLQLKEDLIMIAVHWLGQDYVTPVAEMIRSTRESIEDFMGLIDMIRDYSLPQFDTHVMKSMAREMHRYIAEYLSGI